MPDFPYERDVDEAAERDRRARREAGDRVRVPLARARRVAEALLEELRPACDRIEIAGSIRRGVATVKDVELVAIPSGIARDLFGAVDVEARVPLDDVLDRLMAEGRLRPRLTSAGIARMGRRYKALEAVRSGIGVDLFLVLPPAQWGALLAIRTGPGDFSKRLVTACQARGLVCEGGRLIGRRIPIADRPGYWADVEVQTPEERDFFEACGVPWVEPERRG